MIKNLTENKKQYWSMKCILILIHYYKGIMHVHFLLFNVEYRIYNKKMQYLLKSCVIAMGTNSKFSALPVPLRLRRQLKATSSSSSISVVPAAAKVAPALEDNEKVKSQP